MSRADDLAADLQAASDENVEKMRAEITKDEVPEFLPASRERVRELLTEGGRALVSVKAKESGKHVTVLLSAKKKGPDGRFVSRRTKEGRVGIREAAMIFADDPDAGWPGNGLGSFNIATGEWHRRREAERNRAWAAEKVLFWALAGFDLEKRAEVFVATQCSYCGHKLWDPESVADGVGPECKGRRTKSRAAPRENVLLEEAA